MQTAKLISYGLKQALEIDPISGFVSDFIDDRVKIVMGIQETLPGSGESGEIHQQGANVMNPQSVEIYTHLLNNIEHGIPIDPEVHTELRSDTNYRRTDKQFIQGMNYLKSEHERYNITSIGGSSRDGAAEELLLILIHIIPHTFVGSNAAWRID